jgi:ribosomal protein S18 acetylase RimI-like enzyme
MNPIVTDLTDTQLNAAIESNVRAYLRMTMLAFPCGQAREERGSLRFITGLAHPLFNGLFSADLTSESAEAQIRAVQQEFRRLNLPMVWWIVSTTRPGDMGARLEAHGFLKSCAPNMVLDLSSVEETPETADGLRVCAVTSAESYCAAWSVPMAEAFQLPPSIAQAVGEAGKGLDFSEGSELRCFLGSYEEQAAACSCLFLSAGMAGIYSVGTLPALRGRGFGAAVTRAAIAEARQRGYRYCVLQSSPKGYPLYRRLGFRNCGQVCRYTWQP